MFLFEKKIGNHLSWATIAYNFPSAVVSGFNTTIVDIEIPDNNYSIPLDKIYPHDGFILPTLFGTLPSNFQECLEFCKKNEIILILDNASSPLTAYQDKNICDYGDASFGSCHHTKYLGYGEGGFLVLPEEDYHTASAITNFGFLQNRKYHELSSNFKMSDIAAAFILSHINHYNLSCHQQIQSTIIKKLAEINLKPFGFQEGIIYGNLPIAFPKPTSHLSFRDQGIEANKYYRPLLSLHNSNQLYEKMINFPLHSTLTQYEIDRIIEQIGFHLTPSSTDIT